MYSQAEAAVYDAIYSPVKDYAQEAERLRRLVGMHKRSGGSSLLDVGCGTGLHLSHIRACFHVEGLDMSADQLARARARLPALTFHLADMEDFQLPNRFDVVTCLFSTIGYCKTPDAMRRAIGCMARHLQDGGVLIIEPWIREGDFLAGYLHADFVDQDELKIARMNVGRVEGGISVLEMHYMVGRPTGIEKFVATHELGLFTHEEYVTAIEAAGLTCSYDEEGLMGRGMYVGIR